MKKITAMLLVFSMALSLAACGAKEQKSEAVDDTTVVTEQAQNEQETATMSTASGTTSTGDVDLTALSSTMVYAEVYNMMTDPESYKGRTVTMKGQFSVYEGDSRNYYACLIADATACCAQGIEFVLDGDYSYPKDYPEAGSTITVTGVFDTYTENDAVFCQLIDASMA